MGNAAQHCRLVLFQDSDFAGDLEDSKSPQGESCVFSGVEHLFLSVGCARSKFQSRTVLQDQKIISLDAGLRVDGLPALDLWDTVIEVLRSTNNTVQPNHNCIKETRKRPNPKTQDRN